MLLVVIYNYTLSFFGIYLGLGFERLRSSPKYYVPNQCFITPIFCQRKQI